MFLSPSFVKGLQWVVGLTAVALISACVSDTQSPPIDVPLIDVPSGFVSQAFPLDNIPDAQRFELGRILFYSTSLSRTRTISCATCHIPAKAFTDGLPVSKGVEGRQGVRNTPSLANVGYSPYFLSEGSVPTLEMQVLVPVQEHNEFDMNMLDVVKRLSADSAIVQKGRIAYGRELDAYVITRAIAAFERTIVSGRSRADLNQLNAAENRGKDLFMSSRTNCSSCHNGFLYTSHEFANNGIYESYTDLGRMRFTNRVEDKNIFKIPSLRNVGVTAPYMHNGGVITLREVIESYNRGGNAHPHRDVRIRPLGLTANERTDIEAFLMSLTDHQFLTDSKFRP